MPEYVTAAELGAIVGAAAGSERVTLAAGAANRLVAQWCEQWPEGEPPVAPDAPVTDVTRQAATQLAHGLYRAHVAVGGVFGVDDLVARLPADLVKAVRDLLDADAQAWGLA